MNSSLLWPYVCLPEDLIFGSPLPFFAFLPVFLILYVVIVVHTQIPPKVMGDNARKRLAMFATQFENQLNQTRNNLQKNASGRNAFGGGGGNATHGSGMGGGAGMSAAERRGLLADNDDDEDVIEFEMRKNK